MLRRTGFHIFRYGKHTFKRSNKTDNEGSSIFAKEEIPQY